MVEYHRNVIHIYWQIHHLILCKGQPSLFPWTGKAQPSRVEEVGFNSGFSLKWMLHFSAGFGPCPTLHGPLTHWVTDTALSKQHLNAFTTCNVLIWEKGKGATLLLMVLHQELLPEGIPSFPSLCKSCACWSSTLLQVSVPSYSGAVSRGTWKNLAWKKSI